MGILFQIKCSYCFVKDLANSTTLLYIIAHQLFHVSFSEEKRVNLGYTSQFPLLPCFVFYRQMEHFTIEACSENWLKIHEEEYDLLPFFSKRMPVLQCLIKKRKRSGRYFISLGNVPLPLGGLWRSTFPQNSADITLVSLLCHAGSYTRLGHWKSQNLHI